MLTICWFWFIFCSRWKKIYKSIVTGRIRMRIRWKKYRIRKPKINGSDQIRILIPAERVINWRRDEKKKIQGRAKKLVISNDSHLILPFSGWTSAWRPCSGRGGGGELVAGGPGWLDGGTGRWGWSLPVPTWEAVHASAHLKSIF